MALPRKRGGSIQPLARSPHNKEKAVRDTIYRERKKRVPPFSFNAEVAEVFDDMITRSVPMYGEIIHRQAQMIVRMLTMSNADHPGMRIYDLGCSTGNLALALCERLPAGTFHMIAVDSSFPMLEIFKKRLRDAGRYSDVSCVCQDICHTLIHGAAFVMVNFTLQFLSPKTRDQMLQRIYDGLIPGGALLLSEKTVHPNPMLSKLEVDFHHSFKRDRGYSEMEISQKREALENVLVPETMEHHHERLRQCGFSAIDLWLKWFNFCSWICIK